MKKIMVIALVGTVGLLHAAESTVALTGHIPKQIQNATRMENASDNEPIELSLAVNLDSVLLKQTLNHIYGQSASRPKHFLSAAEFAQAFAVADKRQILKTFALANGLTVDTANDQPDSMIVKVSGDAKHVEDAFHIQLRHYRSPDGKTFRANDTDPMIPASLAPHLGAIVGLSDIQGLWHPHTRSGPVQMRLGAAAPSVVSRASASPQFSGTGPGGTLAPTDIKTIYGLNSVSLTGAGQTAAVFELDGYYPVDIADYETFFNLPNVTPTFIGVDGTTNLCGGKNCATQSPFVDEGMAEVALDIEMIIALAPHIAAIAVYDGPNSDQGVLDTYDKMATDNRAKSISTSWGENEQDSGSAFVNQEALVYQRMAAQGQTIYAASGDAGAYDMLGKTTLSVDDPASQPYVTGVGGTSLSGTVSNPTETVWNNGYDSMSGRYDASGGGVSIFWPTPDYQKGVSGAASQVFRNVPDVSLNADPNSGYAIVVGGLILQEGGTSAAAPLWAALTVLINQQRESASKGDLGFANPALYELATSTSATIYTDITSGNNGFYAAAAGYDNATGWGSYKGSAIIDSASTIAIAALPVSPVFNVYAYPNPWDVRKDAQKKITFANLPADGTVKIFTLAGFWLKTLTAQGGQAMWDLTNDSGQEAASGLYLYLANGTGISNVRGKIALIR